MGYYSNIYEESREKTIGKIKVYAKCLLEDAEDFDNMTDELGEFLRSVDRIASCLKQSTDEMGIAMAKDVAYDMLIDDADFPQLYKDKLISKDRSGISELADNLWRSGKVDNCTYRQVLLGTEEAWTELEETSFEEGNEEETR